jgi:hypothetical protein
MKSSGYSNETALFLFHSGEATRSSVTIIQASRSSFLTIKANNCHWELCAASSKAVESHKGNFTYSQRELRIVFPIVSYKQNGIEAKRELYLYPDVRAMITW